MGWCFALVNKRLAEIYFDRPENSEMKIRGHCYVDRKEYNTKREQRWIEKDTRQFRVVYRNKKYKVVELTKKVSKADQEVVRWTKRFIEQYRSDLENLAKK